MWVDASLGRNGAGSMGCLREVLGDVTLLHRGGLSTMYRETYHN